MMVQKQRHRRQKHQEIPDHILTEHVGKKAVFFMRSGMMIEAVIKKVAKFEVEAQSTEDNSTLVLMKHAIDYVLIER